MIFSGTGHYLLLGEEEGGGSGLCVGGGGGLCVGEYLISPKDSLLSLLYSPPLRLLSFPSFTVPP